MNFSDQITVVCTRYHINDDKLRARLLPLGFWASERFLLNSDFRIMLSVLDFNLQ